MSHNSTVFHQEPCRALSGHCVCVCVCVVIDFSAPSLIPSSVRLQVSSHSDPSSQPLGLQQSAQQPPPPQPPPPPPAQPAYSLPELRDKQLCFSNFEDLSASFRSLYKCVFEQSFSQAGGCRPGWIIGRRASALHLN